MKILNRYAYKMSAAFTVGMLASQDAHAGQDFSKIAENITLSIGGIPGLISGVAYVVGLILAVLGIMKIKDHVENPTQTPLKDGVIRLVVGGGLFALPIILEAMFTTVGTGTATNPALLNKVKFAVGG